MSIVGKSQSGRACAEPASRPSAPRSGGGAKRRALTSVSTRARCWLDDAAGDHNILRSTRVQFLSVPRARQQRIGDPVSERDPERRGPGQHRGCPRARPPPCRGGPVASWSVRPAVPVTNAVGQAADRHGTDEVLAEQRAGEPHVGAWLPNVIPDLGQRADERAARRCGNGVGGPGGERRGAKRREVGPLRSDVS